MSPFFLNFLFLDLQDSVLNTGDESRGDKTAFLNHLGALIATLLQGESFPSIHSVKVVGLPAEHLFNRLAESSLKNYPEIGFLSYSTDDILSYFKDCEFQEGVRKFLGNFFPAAANTAYVFVGLSSRSQSLKAMDGFLRRLYNRIAHDLKSQPIWFVDRDRFKESGPERDILLSCLLHDYSFVDTFPVVLYDGDGLLEAAIIDGGKNQEELKSVFVRLLDTPPTGEGWDAARSLSFLQEICPSHEHEPQPRNEVSSIGFKKALVTEVVKNKKTVLLVEGHDPRVLKAIHKALDLGLEGLAVMGVKDKIESLTGELGIDFGKRVRILNPGDYHKDYAPILYEVLKRKEITREESESLVKSDLNLAGLLLREGVVDGVVAGAHYTTADTLKAAIRMVGLKSGHSMVSSFFIMILPRRVMIFADCAVNPSPDAEQLAEIAWQTIESAHRFLRSDLRVSFISFSTMGSAKTPEVEKVSRAVSIVNTRVAESGKEVIIEGPVQYDTAIHPETAIKKYPSSRIAGRSNVLIFPNLETGNSVYKAVQQSFQRGECDCLGPVIQGLAKPYNDLSRGASVNDILQTILITAMQCD